ncbi:MAG: Gfo/Idh/MocA family oxidoreductase [Rhodothermaceae bacterium]|nr:Gfo/Idh/MocA family oxidoreductase [Rhodothermaceae bacterium]MXZ57918.1 Gfo/Idh/MocA family oxidoreductase [Rhodothermaceae bacterium]MYB91037.1 Gfo/Idh/MocA family oxidoreductase [Rhodothermaceae bacterium]MYD67609.1 Gfo/Idh/MocA family oxidoreductase [Rhodothermaceae bacterium]MYG44832.1 Gfo/Idh/MocA family oxidoreductase [Rhodothermaceae bacterium]
MSRIRWGILSSARIARQKVIPAIQDSQRGTVAAIASRNPSLAQQVAESHQIPTICPTYDDLIQLDTIDAVYIPLPNHLHVEWACKAINAGKHVLCEKPLGLNEMDVQHLLNVSRQYPKQLVAEAFMYRHHPQWTRTREWVRTNYIGELRSIHVHFSYDNRDPDNIRNKLEFGGGALMDIGCYGISVARWLYGSEPKRVCAHTERHPQFRTDTSTTALLDFAQGGATVVCGTQIQRAEHVAIVGTKGKITLQTPFNIPPGEPAYLNLQQDQERTIHTLGPANQFSEQCDAFAAAVIDGEPLYTPIVDSLNNMRVIDACFQSAQTNTWITCEQLTDP